MLKFLKKIWEKLNNTGFRNLLIGTILFIGILYVEKLLYPVSKSLVKLNVLGRTSVIIIFLIVVIFLAFERKRILNLKNFKNNWKSFLIFFPIHLLFFLSFWFFKYTLINNPELINEKDYLIIFLRYLLPFLTALFLFISIFGLSFIKKYYRSILSSLVLSFLFFQISLLFKQYWQLFSVATTKLVALLLSFSFNDVKTDFGVNGPLLGAGGFTAFIQSPCSGIEGLSLFLFLFILIMVLDRKEIDWTKATIAGVMGLGGMFLVNVLRIYLLYLVGIYVNPRTAITYFHTNIGWFLFILYFVVYWFIVYFLIRKRR